MNYDNLNGQQARAVRSDCPYILTLAGAGTGKTHCLTHRMARLYEDGVLPGQMLSISFTRAAASEMKDRLMDIIGPSASDIYCGTFHSWAAHILRSHSYKLGYTPTFSIYDEEDQKSVIDGIIADYGYKLNPKEVLQALKSLYMYNTPPKGDMKEIVNEYKFMLKRNNAMDFDMLLHNLMVLLIQYGDIEKEIREKYTHIFVDEFQDTDMRQMRILELINPHNLFVVGDDFQSIYSFAGADVSIIMDMAEDQRYEVIKLQENYRSTRQIIDPANTLIKHNNQTEKTLHTYRIGPEYELLEMDDRREELQRIADIITDTMEERPDMSRREIAVLSRTNRQVDEVYEFLSACGIPCEIKQSNHDILDSFLTKSIAAWLGVILNLQDDEAVKRAVNWPHERIDRRTMKKVELYQMQNITSLYDAIEATDAAPEFISMVKSLREHMDGINETADYIRRIYNTVAKDYHIEHHLENRNNDIKELEANVMAWGADRVLRGEDTGLNAWLDYLKTRKLDGDYEENKADAVQLMTAHKSKGLEFDSVIIAGCNQGSFPMTRGDIEEERRLFYVSITRAKNNLYLTRGKMYESWSGPAAAMPSIFIEEMKA